MSNNVEAFPQGFFFLKLGSKGGKTAHTDIKRAPSVKLKPLFKMLRVYYLMLTMSRISILYKYISLYIYTYIYEYTYLCINSRLAG